jgi:hypothetical protein
MRRVERDASSCVVMDANTILNTGAEIKVKAEHLGVITNRNGKKIRAICPKDVRKFALENRFSFLNCQNGG